ncbi:MAG: CTP pyrophosphohydrolase [Candidatus Celerinatantimonas neptuna]|nr:MAG: CTP pyrophosphohydrolase [Candidatus Celerinatantimonas neptuna]
MAKQIQVVVGVIVIDGQVLIAKRATHQHQGGLWEFPGGKIESHESEITALSRELNEELGILIVESACEKMLDLEHQYPDLKVALHIYQVTQFHGDVSGKEGQPVLWVSKEDLQQYDFPQANEPILQMLLNAKSSS